MTDASLRRFALDELDSAFIARLATAQEGLFVERKREIPDEGLAPTMASFANTLGGWLVLGVDNEGGLHGFSPPGRADLQDYVRDKIRRDIDPLPAFVATTATHGDTSIGLVRVAESADTPHITSSGTIFVRDPGGKRPLVDHGELLQLARRGEASEVEARARLIGLDLINDALVTPDRIVGDEPGRDHPQMLEWILRASPLTVSGGFATRALAESTSRAATGWTSDLLPNIQSPEGTRHIEVQAKARGMVLEVEQLGLLEHGLLAIDAGGVIAARRARRRIRGTLLHVPGAKEEDLLRLSQAGFDGDLDARTVRPGERRTSADAKTKEVPRRAA